MRRVSAIYCPTDVGDHDARHVGHAHTHIYIYDVHVIQEFGDILLAISYLPTAQRLTINIMKLRDIKLASTMSSLTEFSEYVFTATWSERERERNVAI